MANNFEVLTEDWSKLDSWRILSGRDNLSVVAQSLVYTASDTPTSLLAITGGFSRYNSAVGGEYKYTVVTYTVVFNKTSGEGNLHFRIPLFDYARGANSDRTPELIYNGLGVILSGSNVDFGNFTDQFLEGSTFQVRVYWNGSSSYARCVITNGTSFVDSGNVADLGYYLGQPKQFSNSSQSCYPACFAMHRDNNTCEGTITISNFKLYANPDSTEVEQLLSGTPLALYACPDPTITLSQNDAPAGTIVQATIDVPGVTSTYRVLRYTTDGTDPSTSATSKFVGKTFKINITKTCTLRVVCGSTAYNYTKLSNVVSQDVRIGVGVAGTYVARPRISPNLGCETVGKVHLVSLQCDTSNALIYYTVDGSTPSQSSTLYTKPFVVTETSTVQAIAYYVGLTPSEVAYRRFLVGPQVHTDNFADLSNWIYSGNASVAGNVMTVSDATGVGVRLKPERTSQQMCFSFTVDGPFRLRLRNSRMEVAWKQDPADSQYKLGLWEVDRFVSGHVLASNAGATVVYFAFMAYAKHLIQFASVRSSRNASTFSSYSYDATPGNNGFGLSDPDVEYEFTSQGIADFQVSNWFTVHNLYESQSNPNTYHAMFVSTLGVGTVCSPPTLSSPGGELPYGTVVTVTRPVEVGTGNCFTISEDNTETSVSSFTIGFHNLIKRIGFRSGYFTSVVHTQYRTPLGCDLYGLSKFKHVGPSVTPPENIEQYILNFGKHTWEYVNASAYEGHKAGATAMHDTTIVADELRYVNSDLDDETSVVCEFRFQLPRINTNLAIGFVFGDSQNVPAVLFKNVTNSNRYHGSLRGTQGLVNRTTLEHVGRSMATHGRAYTYADGYYSSETGQSDPHTVRVARRFQGGQLQCRAMFYEPTHNATYGIKIPKLDTGWFNCDSTVDARPKVVVLNQHTEMCRTPSQFDLYRHRMWKNVTEQQIDNLLKYGVKDQLPLVAVSYSKQVDVQYGETIGVTLTPTTPCRLYCVYSESGNDDPIIQTRHGYYDGVFALYESYATPGIPVAFAVKAPAKLTLRAVYTDAAYENLDFGGGTSRLYNPSDLQTISVDVDPSTILELVSSKAGEATFRVKSENLSNSILGSSFFEYDDGLRNWRSTYQNVGYTTITRQLSPGDHSIKLARWGSSNQKTYWSNGSTLPFNFQVPDKLACSFSVSSAIATAGQAVQFVASTFGGLGSKSYLWDFGDGSSSTLQSPTHSFSSPGIFTVKLYVTDSNGDDATSIKYNAVLVEQEQLSTATPTLVKTTRIS